jgi:Domain of unknown function (DUF3883)
MEVAGDWLLARYAARDIVDTHANSPYDFAVVDRVGKQQLFVEVKGLASAFGPVFVTAGDVNAARHDGVPTLLMVVCDVKLVRDESGSWAASGGTRTSSTGGCRATTTSCR